jgi:hypothetical protein
VKFFSFLAKLFGINKDTKTKEQKREEIINQYLQKLNQQLSLVEDRDLYLQKKSALLKEFSLELSRNIFFDMDEIKIIIENLANNS